MKFYGMLTHMNLVTFAEHKKNSIFNTSRWWPATISKTVKSKFGMVTHIAHVNRELFTVPAYILCLIFCLVKLQKLQK